MEEPINIGNIRIVKEDLPPREFATIRARNTQLGTLVNTLWINDDFDLVIWRPSLPNPRLNGHWAQAVKVVKVPVP